MSERRPRRVSRDDWQPSARQTEQTISAAQQFIATLSPEERQDHKLLVDLLEGQTDFFELLDGTAEYYKALDLLIDKVQSRLKRLKAKANRAHDAWCKMAEAAQIQHSVERPFYLATYDEDQPTSHIVDENLLPRHVLRPDLRDITARLKRGEAVPGAILNNPGSRHFVLRFS